MKVFIVTGELSGDKLAAWFVDKCLSDLSFRQKVFDGLRRDRNDIAWEGIGGDFLFGLPVEKYGRFECLNIVGVFEVLRKLPYIFRFLKKTALHIVKEGFDCVVLVDYPGFNLRLAKIVKRLNPRIKIIYLSPPQLWVWGRWRLKSLRSFSDKVIVLYPFEVEWYKSNGLNVLYLGNPIYDRLKSFLPDLGEKWKKPGSKKILLAPGSRRMEIDFLLPIMKEIVELLRDKGFEFVVLGAESMNQQFLEQQLKRQGLSHLTVVYKDEEKKEAMKEALFAISKPGTITLELALFGVKTILIYKVSWPTYLLARWFVHVKWMGIMNLFFNKEIVPEFIQGDCVPARIVKSLAKKTDVRQEYKDCDLVYFKKLRSLLKYREL